MSVFNSTLIGSRDAFDPSRILSTIEHGDQVLVLDSKKLPSDWYQDVLTDFLPEDHHHTMKVQSIQGFNSSCTCLHYNALPLFPNKGVCCCPA